MHKASYNMKNSICLFERLFKVQKIGIFLFGISFFFLDLEILTFLYYTNWESDDITSLQLKIVKYWIINISGNIEAVFFKLCTRNLHCKRNQMIPIVLLPWKLSWLQSFSVKNQISSFSNLQSRRGCPAWNRRGLSHCLNVNSFH